MGSEFQINSTFQAGVATPDVELGWNGVVGVIWRDDEASGDANEIRAKAAEQAARLHARL